ncbi:uncharacterized protein V1510DRAFT_423390 [Dipodascopsis tothii]|uniref:uncharacterized protein n=1 Tax=Dipodascopsis tothii TaxID=44089 RepID=UPI0034CEF8B1
MPSAPTSSGRSNGLGVAAGVKRGTGPATAAAVEKPVAAVVAETAPNLDPLNFDTFPVTALRKYRTSHNLTTPSALSNDGMLLNGSIGKKTWSYKHRTRVPKEELASAVKKHFQAQNVRETDMIAGFLYSVKNQDRALKLPLITK